MPSDFGRGAATCPFSSFLSPVHLSAMSYSFDQNAMRLVADAVNNAIIADSYPETATTALESNNTYRPRLLCQRLEAGSNTELDL